MGSEWIELCNGGRFAFDDPDPEMITLDVIAYSLANLCRYTGHCRPFFSVAQHSVMVSYLVPEEFALQGLLHDAAEAFTGDLSRPLKAWINAESGGAFTRLEQRIERLIAERFGLPYPFDPSVKHADNVALATERRDYMPDGVHEWIAMPDPDPHSRVPFLPEGALAGFLGRAEELGVTP